MERGERDYVLLVLAADATQTRRGNRHARHRDLARRQLKVREETNTHLHARQLLDAQNRLRHADRVRQLVQTLVDLLSPLLSRVALRSHRRDLALGGRVRLHQLQLLRKLLDLPLLLRLAIHQKAHLSLRFDIETARLDVLLHLANALLQLLHVAPLSLRTTFNRLADAVVQEFIRFLQISSPNRNTHNHLRALFQQTVATSAQRGKDLGIHMGVSRRHEYLVTRLGHAFELVIGISYE